VRTVSAEGLGARGRDECKKGERRDRGFLTDLVAGQSPRNSFIALQLRNTIAPYVTVEPKAPCPSGAIVCHRLICIMAVFDSLCELHEEYS
jgi:hypothetical protein